MDTINNQVILEKPFLEQIRITTIWGIEIYNDIKMSHHSNIKLSFRCDNKNINIQIRL